MSTFQLTYLPLQQRMPLLNPKYPQQYYTKFEQLKKHIQLKLFTTAANQLAEQLISFGETNYNCWYVKKMCFLNGVVDFQHEMEFSQETLYEKVKNFQLWEHRRFLLERKNGLQNYQRQYQLINAILDIEPKNYHAWSHRVWLLGQVKNYQQQLEFTQEMLLKDLFNNSVWAHRTHVMQKIVQSLQQRVQEQQQIIDREIAFTLPLIQKHMNNHAAWNYLRGYLPSIRLTTIPSTNHHIFTFPISTLTFSRILQFTQQKLSQLQKLLSYSLESSTAKQYHFQSQIQLLITLATLLSHDLQSREYARNSCLLLAEKQTQKRFYWKWVANNL